MIDKNLGPVERILRLATAVFLGILVLSSSSFGVLEGIASVAALFLVLNALSSRCYLWSWLGLNTCECQRVEDGSCDSETAG